MYKTNDVRLASALRYHKVMWREIKAEDNNGKRETFFYYDETPEFESLSNDFYSGRLGADSALDLFVALKETKKAMFLVLDKQ